MPCICLASTAHILFLRTTFVIRINISNFATMQSLILALGLLSAATIGNSQVVNGVSMVPAPGSSSGPAPSPSGSPSSSVQNNGGSGYPGSSPAYGASPSYTESPSNSAPPSMYTTPPSYSSSNFYDTMPYSSFMGGGYQSLGCGYGYVKQSDGSCSPASWVCFIIASVRDASF